MFVFAIVTICGGFVMLFTWSLQMSGTFTGTNRRSAVRRRSGLGRQPDMEGLEEIGHSSEVANVIPSSTQVSFQAHSGFHAFGCTPTLEIEIKSSTLEIENSLLYQKVHCKLVVLICVLLSKHFVTSNDNICLLLMTLGGHRPWRLLVSRRFAN